MAAPAPIAGETTAVGAGPTLWTVQFRGVATTLEPGVVLARATAPSGILATVIDDEGVHGTLEPRDGAEALLEWRLTLHGGGRFTQVGTIAFGNGNALRFRSAGDGLLTPSTEPGLRQGASAWAVDGGSGVFAGATGRIVSNFLLADTGDLTDQVLGLIFVR